MQTPTRTSVDRPRRLSVRLKLTLSYAGFLMVAGFGLIAVVWVFLLRYVPDQAITMPVDRIRDDTARPVPPLFIPGRSDLWEAFAPKAAIMLAFLLVFGFVGGWILAGRMLAPLNRITDATRRVGSGSLSHRIHLPGRRDEFRELADAFDACWTGSKSCRRTAEIRGQRLSRTAHTAGDHADTSRRGPQDSSRATSELVDILHNVNSRRSTSPTRYCS